MKSRIVGVRIIGVATATALIAIFVHLYGIMQANWLQYGLKVSLKHLPAPTIIYYQYSFLGYILPVAAFLTFFVGRKGRESRLLHIEAILSFISIIALIWLFACILAWQLPAYYPVSVIR